MPLIRLTTYINATITACFNASRNIDVHMQTMEQSKEKAVSGITTGLIGLHETVTWKARHFGLWWTMTVKITQLDPPASFTDEMVRGPFAYMRHKHSFTVLENGTLMIDEFNYASPLGWLGKLADKLFVHSYMTKLLSTRNQWIKEHIENTGIKVSE